MTGGLSRPPPRALFFLLCVFSAAGWAAGEQLAQFLGFGAGVFPALMLCVFFVLLAVFKNLALLFMRFLVFAAGIAFWYWLDAF
ncbi:hypothetical protein [Shewanella algae]|uniref:hypothetical protein n=1 Tax=Shewanella algae TaxID=38313 RepID=UPI0031F5CDD5